MDGENDAAQGGTAAEAGQAAAAQANGNPAGAGGASDGTEGAAATQAAEADLAAQVAERDERIKELESQLEAQETDRELALVGCRSARAARALLGDHDGDIAALKAAEPWLFADGEANANDDGQQSGTTGLKPAGTDASKATVARWERLAGLSDDEEKE